jgi:hypothetical protein
MMANRYEDGNYEERAQELDSGFMNRLYDRVSKQTEPVAQPPEEENKLLEAVQHVVTMYTAELRRQGREQDTAERSRNQMIAEMIVSLPYREAIAMGEGIAAKLKQGSGSESWELSAEILTRAIQAWADGDK